MSNTIDNKVVEMRFDNAQFESATKQSMSTLEKLKNSLKFDKSAGQSFDSISKAAKNVNLSGLDNGIQTLQARFSALQVVGVTALANITNSAIQAGKNIVSSFTVAPIVDGLREYELQLNSVQTILANTQSKGTTIDQVNAALNELNKYADLTIYNFSEMTRNIGTFTAAGVDLDTSVSSIKGIANLAAVSGSSATQASTAMYQLSQAIAAGKIQLMDWNSVVNAGMGGELFQNALKRTAEHFGTDVDAMIKKYGSFRESLTSGGWLTTKVLTETLTQLSGAYSEADLIAQGYTESQAKEIASMADTALNAATKVKTFTQLMDTLKEAVGSGWAQTWQLIFGDFEEAKEFFTGLSDHFSDMINSFSDARNALLGDALSSPFDSFKEQLISAGVSMDDFQSKLVEVGNKHGIAIDKIITKQGSLSKAFISGKISSDLVIETLKELSNANVETGKNTEDLNAKLSKFQKVVDDVWNGDYKNGKERINALAKAGYDYKQVQDLVNKSVDGQRLTLADLNEEQLKNIGYTEEEIVKIEGLAVAAEKAGTPLNDLINSLQKKSGRELLLDSVWNVITAIEKPLKAVGKAWNKVFAIDSSDLYDLIEGLEKFTKSLIISDKDAENLSRTMKGLFSVLHILATFAGNSLSVAFKVANAILGLFGTNVLEVTGNIGDAIYEFDRFITSNEGMTAVIKALGSALSVAGGYVVKFFDGFSDYPIVKSAKSVISDFFENVVNYVKQLSKLSPGDALKKIFDDIKTVFSNIRSYLSQITWDDVLKALTELGEKVRDTFKDVTEQMKEIGPDLIEGLQNGIKENASKVFEWMAYIGERLVEAIKAVLGIHSPSTVMYEVGKNIVLGLINGIRDFIGGVSEAFGTVGEDIKNTLTNIDWGAVAVSIISVGALASLYKFTDALQSFGVAAKNMTAPVASAGKVMDSISGAIDTVTGRIKGTNSKFLNIANGIKILAEAIAILTAAVVSLTLVDQNSLLTAVGVIGVLSAIIAALAVVLNKFASGGSAMEAVQLNVLLLSLAGSFTLLAVAAKIIASVSWEGLGKAGAGLIVFGGVVAGLIAATKSAGDKIDQASNFILKISAAFTLLAVAAKLFETISWEGLGKAGAGLIVFGGVVTGLIAATMLSGSRIDQATSFISKISTAFLLLAITAKLIASMSWGDMGKAAVGLLGLGAIMTGLIAATKLAGEKEIAEIGTTLIALAGAMAILAIVARLIAGMSWEDMGKAAVGLLGLGAIIAVLVAATRLAGKEQMAKVAATLLAMSISIAILAGVAVLLGMVKEDNLKKGVAAVAVLAALVSAMTQATRGASDVKGSFIGIAVAIGVLAAAVAILSFIEPEKLASSVVAMSVVMAMLALVASQMKGMAGVKVGPILALVAALAVITASLMLLSQQPWDSLLAAGVSISAVLIALAAACKILDGVGTVSGSALGAVAILGLISAGLAVVLSNMKEMDPASSIGNAVALSTLLIAMSAACAILGTIGAISSTALVAMGVLTAVIAGLAVVISLMDGVDPLTSIGNAVALSTLLIAMSAACVILGSIGSVAPMSLVAIGVLTLVVAGLAAVIVYMKDMDPASSIGNVIALSTMLLAMAGVTAILSAIGPMASAALAGAGAMAAVLAVLAGVVVAAGAIKQIPGVDWLVSEGAAFLSKLGEAIGGFVGSIVGSFLEGVTASLPALAMNLSMFAMGLLPFITTMKMIDPSILESVGVITGAVIALTAADFISGIASFLGIGDGFDQIATKFGQLGVALSTFAIVTSGIDAEHTKTAAQALKYVVQALSEIPNEGGFLDSLFGTKDYGKFASGIKSIGEGLKEFATSVAGADMSNVNTGAEALGTLLSKLQEIPETGGLLQSILGGKNYEGFASGIKSIGEGLKEFATSVSIVNLEKVTAGSEALGTLMDTLKNIPPDGGLLGALLGSEAPDYSGFAAGMVSLGNGLVQFETSVGELDFVAIGNAINSITKISELFNSLTNFNTETVTSFTNGLKTLGSTSIDAFVTSFKDGETKVKEAVQGLIDAVPTAMEGVASKMKSAGKSAGKSLATSLSSGLQNGIASLRSKMVNTVSEVASAIEGKSSVFNSAGKALAKNLADGTNTSKDAITKNLKGPVESAATAIRGYYSNFYNAGKYLCQGLANGISANSYMVRARASAMASAAATAARSALDINSPSKVFRKIGYSIPDGLAQGIDRMSKMVSGSSESMADKAVSGTNAAIKRISEMSFDDLDANPTIRPVLDLSNVEAGANSINGMFSNMIPVSLLGEVGSINRSMNQLNQNGSIDDIVSAVNKLRKDLGDIGGPSYTINGITYDDGTAVGNAVGDLVRAMRIERRI